MDEFYMLVKDCINLYDSLDDILKCIDDSDISDKIPKKEFNAIIKDITLTCSISNNQIKCIFCKTNLPKDNGTDKDYHEECQQIMKDESVDIDAFNRLAFKKMIKDENIGWNLSWIEKHMGDIFSVILKKYNLPMNTYMEYLDRLYFKDNHDEFFNTKIAKYERLNMKEFDRSGFVLKEMANVVSNLFIEIRDELREDVNK